MEKEKILYNDYTCGYCGTKFKARSGVWRTSGVVDKNVVVCFNCGNNLENKGEL